MSKLFQRKGFRLASVAYFLSLGTLAVALFAWFSTSSTFSWFASNKDVDATGMAIKVKTDDEVDIDVEVYKYVEETKDETTTLSDGSESTEKVGKGEYRVQKLTLDDDLEMSRYDQVFQEDNDYAPILMKLTLKGGSYKSGDALPLVIHHNKDYDKIVNKTDGTTITISDTESQYHLSSYISSVVSVKAMVYNDSVSWTETSDSSSEDSKYESLAHKVFKTMESKFTKTDTPQYKTRFFVQDSSEPKTGAAKKEDVNFSDDKTSAEGVNGNLLYNSTKINGTDTCTVYVWIDYDETTTKWSESFSGYYGLVNAYINQMSGSSLGINVSYKLASDITQISIVSTDLDNTSSSSSN